MQLTDYRKCFNHSYDQFLAAHHIDSNSIHDNVRYEKILGVTRIDFPDGEFFFFKDGQLAVIYISGEVLPQKVYQQFKAIAGDVTPDKTVRSRAGTSNQLIFASHGITVSTNHKQVDFVEIYQPCALQDYLEHIYREVQPFIR